MFHHETSNKIKKLKHKIHIFIQGEEIERKSTIRHLGVIFHEHLRWKSHIEHVLKKISKFVPIFATLKSVLTTERMKLLYSSLVYPHLTYCVEVWGQPYQNKTNISKLLHCQKKLVRLMTGSQPHTPSAPLFQMLNIFNIFQIVTLHQTMLVHQLLTVKDTKIEIALLQVSHAHVVNSTLSSRGLNLRPMRSNTSIGQRGIEFQICKNWNALPIELHEKIMSHEFVQLAKKHALQTIV